VPDDNVGPLNAAPIEGHFTTEVETALLHSPETLSRVARDLLESQFPLSLAADVLAAVGLDPDLTFGMTDAPATAPQRKRSANWRHQIVAAWDRSCAFCGFDGALGGAPVGIEAAHIRWFNFEGPDDLDNGLALCSLHHKLFDRGALGLADPATLVVSSRYSAASPVGRNLYDLHGRELRPRPGTKLPSQHYVDWHTNEVFKGEPLSA
jgi:putative restriction endonuclease